MSVQFLVEQIRTAYGLSQDEAQRMVRNMVATVQLDHLRGAAQSLALYRQPFFWGDLSVAAAGELAQVGVFNPLASGYMLVLTHIGISPEANATQCTLRYLTDFSGFTSSDVETWDTRFPGGTTATKSMAILGGVISTGGVVGARIGDQVARNANADQFEVSGIFRPGTGLSVQGITDGDVFAHFHGYAEPEQERPAP